MAIERNSIGEYVTWVLALVGIWLLASPFVYGASVSGAARNNYFGTGIVVLVLSAFLAYRVRGPATP